MSKRKARQPKPEAIRTRSGSPQADLPPDFIRYYRTQFVPDDLSEQEFDAMLATFKTSLPHVFRLRDCAGFENLHRKLTHFVETLREHGFDASRVSALDERFGVIYKLNINVPTLRHDPNVKPFHEWLTHNSEVGTIVRQELVSMIPPFFLDVAPDHHVLDCCASPGSKTSQIVDKICGVTGLLVANDVSPSRCRTLVHTLNRYDMTKSVVISHPAQYLPDVGRFDRVLCDVPCSGDGTLRKNPDAAEKWSIENGYDLHPVQRAILIRALQLLKVGGVCVYSTCSLKPIEDEAVINSTLLEMQGAVEVVDCEGAFPALVRSHGMTSWKVLDNEFVELENNEKTKTLFPQPQIPELHRCMRFLPHQNDTGGFFVAVLRKKSEFDVDLPRLAHKPLSRWREPPFRPLADLSKDVVSQIVSDYGFPSDFDASCLFVHDEACVNNIYLVNSNVRDVLGRMPYDTLRPMAAGVRIFTWKTLTEDEDYVHAIPCVEGMYLLTKLATKRKVELPVEQIYRLIKAGNDGVYLKDLALPESIMQERPGGFLFHAAGTDLWYGVIRMKHKFVLYVKKEFRKYEMSKLEQFVKE